MGTAMQRCGIRRVVGTRRAMVRAMSVWRGRMQSTDGPITSGKKAKA